MAAACSAAGAGSSSDSPCAGRACEGAAGTLLQGVKYSNGSSSNRSCGDSGSSGGSDCSSERVVAQSLAKKGGSRPLAEIRAVSRGGQKRCDFHLRIVLKETPCPPKSPQPARCTDVHGGNTYWMFDISITNKTALCILNQDRHKG